MTLHRKWPRAQINDILDMHPCWDKSLVQQEFEKNEVHPEGVSAVDVLWESPSRISPSDRLWLACHLLPLGFKPPKKWGVLSPTGNGIRQRALQITKKMVRCPWASLARKRVTKRVTIACALLLIERASLARKRDTKRVTIACALLLIELHRQFPDAE